MNSKLWKTKWKGTRELSERKISKITLDFSHARARLVAALEEFMGFSRLSSHHYLSLHYLGVAGEEQQAKAAAAAQQESS